VFIPLAPVYRVPVPVLVPVPAVGRPAVPGKPSMIAVIAANAASTINLQSQDKYKANQ